jgi:hypothetical protein
VVSGRKLKPRGESVCSFFSPNLEKEILILCFSLCLCCSGVQSRDIVRLFPVEFRVDQVSRWAKLLNNQIHLINKILLIKTIIRSYFVISCT